jgi:hypothetical protein
MSLDLYNASILVEAYLSIASMPVFKNGGIACTSSDSSSFKNLSFYN